MDLPGTCVHDLARDFSLWAPSTFEECHWGSSWTYRHKHGDKAVRIDYVLLPLCWRCGVVSTWTDATIHAGQSIIDHIAVVVDLTLPTVVDACTRPQRSSRPRLDEKAILDPANRHLLECIVDAAPDVPWHVSAHAHASSLGPSTHAFLGPDALALRKQLSRARHGYARLRTVLRTQCLRVAFDSWLHSKRVDVRPRYDPRGWTKAANFAAALYGWDIACLAKALRKACCEDKAAYLSQLAERVSFAKDGQAFQAVRRLLGHKRRKPFCMDGAFDCEFPVREPEHPCPGLAAALSALGHVDAAVVIQEVSRFAAPIAVIRAVVETWRMAFLPLPSNGRRLTQGTSVTRAACCLHIGP